MVAKVAQDIAAPANGRRKVPVWRINEVRYPWRSEFTLASAKYGYSLLNNF